MTYPEIKEAMRYCQSGRPCGDSCPFYDKYSKGRDCDKEFGKIFNQFFFQYRQDIATEMALEFYDLCCGHGTTYIKKYLSNKYGVGKKK